MNIDSNSRKDLINHRLNQAEETILDVELLIQNNRLRAAVNRIYYGMFYTLLALALAYKFESSKHSQLIGWFNQKFIHTGLISQKYGKSINKAFNRRTKSDYDIYIDFEIESVNEMYQEMIDFISTIKSFLKKEAFI